MLGQPSHAQDASVQDGSAQDGQALDGADGSPQATVEEPLAVRPASGSLKVLSWNVATSPYAIEMRKIKAAAPSWRTSFGAERRTINPPKAPQAADFDYDVVLLQGVINPRALRRLFPARMWRLILSPRALARLPKGSVFTAPVSTTEIEAVAVRYRQGLRIGMRDEVSGTAPADLSRPEAGAASDAPGVAVKVVDRGRVLWFASVSLDQCAKAQEVCAAWEQMTRWRLARRQSGDATVLGGRIFAQEEDACGQQSIEAELPASGAQGQLGKGERRDLLGCVAELAID